MLAMAKMMLCVLLVGALLVAGIWVLGSRLPVEHTAKVSTTIDLPIDQLWAEISNFERWRSWRKDVTAVEIVAENQVIVTDNNGTIRYRIEYPGPYQMVAEIDQTGLPFGGRWVWALEAVNANKTNVTIEERAEHFVARYVLGYDRTMRNVLSELETIQGPI